LTEERKTTGVEDWLNAEAAAEAAAIEEGEVSATIE
jgi:hypothetical protein